MEDKKNQIQYLISIFEIAFNTKTELKKYNWKKIDELLMITTEIFDSSFFVNEILSSLIPAAPQHLITKLFDEKFIPGTFFLSDRLFQPAFISEKDNLPFKDWIFDAVVKEVQRLTTACPETRQLLENKERNKKIAINEFIYFALFFSDFDGVRLLEKVPNQIYQDVITKIISYFLFDNANMYPYVEKVYNEKVEEVSYYILEKLPALPVRTLFNYSVAAGSLGVDMKSSASAASPINKSLYNIIFYNLGNNEDIIQKKERMYAELTKKAYQPFEIDCWNEFDEEIISAKKTVILVWFHDDCAETMFDLNFIQKVLLENDNISVVSIPRSGKSGMRYGNDASSVDIKKHLSNKYFLNLKKLYDLGRFSFTDEGPCWGAVYGLHFSESIVNLVLQCTAIVVKGSRSYEMLQGIQCTAYFASMVCRDFSESVFAVDSETGSSVFLKQETALPSFEGFKERNQQTLILKNGKKINICRMTAKDYLKAIANNNYKKICNKFNNLLSANNWIKEQAKTTNKTIAEFIESYDEGIHVT